MPCLRLDQRDVLSRGRCSVGTIFPDFSLAAGRGDASLAPTMMER
jgi:hypothetical protein